MTATPAPTATPAADTTRSRWYALAAVCFGMMLTFLNITATISSVPAIGEDLQADSTIMVWIPSIFALTVASLVLSAGTVGDVIGRRTAFITGSGIMAVGSLGSYLAHSSTWFLAAQAITGLGAALVLPNSLAIISSIFTEPGERTEAISIWAACSGLGLAIGPLSAGAILGQFSWNAVFLVNAIAALLVTAIAGLVVPQSRIPSARLDPIGLITGTVAIASLTYWIIDGSKNGFGTTGAIIAIVAFVCALAIFIGYERAVDAPMLDLKLFRSPSFSTVLVLSATVLFGFTGLSFITVLYLERVGALSAWTTGVHLLALMVTYVVVSGIAPRLLPRLGFKVILTGGLLITSVGALLLLRVHPDDGYTDLSLALVVLGIGFGSLIAPATAAAMNSVAPIQAGMASAAVNMFRQLGGVLGTSVLGSILTTQLAQGLLTRTPAEAFESAFHTCAVVAAVVFAVVAVPTVIFVHSRPAHISRT